MSFRISILSVVCSIPILCAQCEAQTYTNLLSGASLSHWMTPGGDAVKEGWQIESGNVLHLSGRGGNIITREEFGDFDLWFDYRVEEKGNNGIKYRVLKYGDSLLGLEYQIQDDGGFPDMHEKHKTAALYDLFEPSLPIFERQYKPLSEFSTGRIVVQNNRIRHWMNGQLIIDECSDSARFSDAVQNSKFRDREGFGRNHKGRLMLTDHNSDVWFRNLYIRRLDGCDSI